MPSKEDNGMEKRDLKADLAKLEHMYDILGPTNDFMRNVLLKDALQRAIVAEEELDRLREENERLKASMSIIEFDNDQEYQEFMEYAYSNKKTNTPQMERLRALLKKHRQEKKRELGGTGNE